MKHNILCPLIFKKNTIENLNIFNSIGFYAALQPSFSLGFLNVTVGKNSPCAPVLLLRRRTNRFAVCAIRPLVPRLLNSLPFANNAQGFDLVLNGLALKPLSGWFCDFVSNGGAVMLFEASPFLCSLYARLKSGSNNFSLGRKLFYFMRRRMKFRQIFFTRKMLSILLICIIMYITKGYRLYECHQ